MTTSQSAPTPPEHLLLIAIGPVQDFIASARTCHDLWFGSWLLSDLARTVARSVHDDCGPRSLIFPATTGNERVAVANKILAVLPAGVDVHAVAAVAQQRMNERLIAIRDAAFDRFGASVWERALAQKQVDDLMEYYWVAIAMNADRPFNAQRVELERLLAARKTTPGWGPVTAIAHGRGRFKGTFDGKREGVLPQEIYDRHSMLSPAQLWERYRIKPQEHLCGVSAVKRRGIELGSEGAHYSLPAFHSTSQIAASALLVRAMRIDGTPASLAKYFTSLSQHGIDLRLEDFAVRTATDDRAELTIPWAVTGDGPLAHVTSPRAFGEANRSFDGALLFEGRLREALEASSPHTGAKLDDAVESAKSKLAATLRALEMEGEVPPYYAFVQADGDGMGKLIHELSESTEPLEQLRRLSAALDAFAMNARELVERAGGSLIYAGGDDVLAMLPLYSVLAFVGTLREAFSRSLVEVCAQCRLRPSISVGVAIVHHQEPIVDVRELAKKAERLAKRERDSLAVVLSMRNGGTFDVTGRWANDLCGRLTLWTTALDREELPDSIVFELERTLLPLFGVRPVATDQSDYQYVLDRLVRRTISRRRASRGATLGPLSLEDTIMAQLLSAPSVEDGIAVLAAEIRIARVLQKSYRVAWGAAPVLEQVAS